MTYGIFARLFAAALLSGVAAPAFAQDIDGPVDLPPLGAADPAAPVADAVPVADPKALAVAAALAEAAPKDAAGRRVTAAVTAFYADRADMPAWTTDAGPTAAARAVVDRLAIADTDGLEPSSLAIPAAPAGTDPLDLARFDVALSRAIVTFAGQATGGRIEPGSINRKFITRKPPEADGHAALADVAAATDPAAALEEFNPPNEAFRRLKAKLAEVRARAPEEKPEPLPDGKSLKPGMSDPRVVLLRARLDLPEVADPELAPTYDDVLADAVKAFQRSSGLLDDGIVGPRTVAVLNGVDRDEVGEIVANMEMWRWMPRNLGSEHVFVNIPEFMVRVVRHGVQTHETRVVVGTQTNQTPVFSDEMEYLVVNPYWHVPESIRMKEMLPEIQADPAGFFRRNGYEAVWNGQVIDPTRVVWDENAIKYVAIRQPPSEANALGRIKFMFPNQHAVYLHDTPSRKLFQRDWRAYSHGCVRVDDPMEFARAILEDEAGINVDTLTAMFGGNEQRVDLSQHVRVHIAYFNVWVDDQGVLQMRDDLYGHTAKVKEALERLAAATN